MRTFIKKSPESIWLYWKLLTLAHSKCWDFQDSITLGVLSFCSPIICQSGPTSPPSSTPQTFHSGIWKLEFISSQVLFSHFSSSRQTFSPLSHIGSKPLSDITDPSLALSRNHKVILALPHTKIKDDLSLSPEQHMKFLPLFFKHIGSFESYISVSSIIYVFLDSSNKYSIQMLYSWEILTLRSHYFTKINFVV